MLETERAMRVAAEQKADDADSVVAQMSAELEAAQASAERKKPMITIDGTIYQINAKVFIYDSKEVTIEQLRENAKLQAHLVEIGSGILTRID